MNENQKMRDISKARLPGLSYHKLSDTIYLVLDLRDPIRIRYVGLVCQIPLRYQIRQVVV